MRQKHRRSLFRRLCFWVLVIGWEGILAAGCARLPYTVRTVHADERVVVTIQQEIQSPSYTHPVQITGDDMVALLRGFSIREQQRLPLRWFAEEAPPKPLFREDELLALAPYLAETLHQLGPNERAHFESRGPGFNPSSGRDVVAGWVAVRDPYLYLTVEYFHMQIPIRKFDQYDYNYPTPPPQPRDYILYFEPGRFWIADENGIRAVEYRQFFKSGEAGARTPR